jgi:hypothetical protein
VGEKGGGGGGGGEGGVRKRGEKAQFFLKNKTQKMNKLQTSIKHQQQSICPMYEKNFIDEIDHKYTIVHDG